MEANPTIIVSLITAIAAIIAPIITAYLNNNTQLKLKNTDLFYKEKSDAYQKFCTTASLYINEWINDDDDNKCPSKNEYLKAHQLSYLMSDAETRSLLDQLQAYYSKSTMNEKEIKTLLSNIIKSMNKDLTNYRNKI